MKGRISEQQGASQPGRVLRCVIFSNHPSIIYPYLSCSILQVTFLLGRIFAACPTQLDDARVLRFGRSSKVLTEKNQKSR